MDGFPGDNSTAPARRETRGLQIGDQADLATFGREGYLGKVPPRRLLLLVLVLFVGELAGGTETAFDEAREAVAFDHADHVEVEVTAVFLRRSRVEG